MNNAPKDGKGSQTGVVPPVAKAEAVDQRTEAQKAADHDKAFGKLTPHMADYYDNEHRSEMRG